MTLWRLSGPLSSTTKLTGIYPNDTWSGPHVRWTRHHARAASSPSRSHSDPNLVGTELTDVLALVRGRPAARILVPPVGSVSLRVPLASVDGSCVVDFEISPTRIPAQHDRGQHRHAAARGPLRRVRLPPAGMRIVVDVSPLSHPRTGIGNYIRGSLAGIVEAAAGRHELLAFAPTSLRGPRAIGGALDGIPVARRLLPLPASHALRTAWSRAGHPAVERLAGRLDVFVFSDWMYPAQRAGSARRCSTTWSPSGTPSGAPARTISMHARKSRNAARTCDVVFANSEATAADLVSLLGIGPDRIVHAPPGLAPGLSRRR